MQLIKKYGEELGAVMNTTKTRILTSTLDVKTSEALQRKGRVSLRLIGKALGAAILAFSTRVVDGKREAHEVTNGLRVLGAPIGSRDFCHGFVAATMASAHSDSKKIIEGLDDDQTRLQLFKASTVHKLTHLFTTDVLNSDMTCLPPRWNSWRGELCDSFSSMVTGFLSDLTGLDNIPLHCTSHCLNVYHRRRS